MTIIGLSSVVAAILWACNPAKNQNNEPTEQAEPISVVALLRAQHGGLTDWQTLTMAIAWTESKFSPDAVGASGDFGALQLTEMYVAEVNRIAGTSFTHEDAFDTDKAIQMFELMQDAKNPTHDIEKAIYFHNKSDSYRRLVLQNLEMIRRAEAFRAKLTAK